MVRKTSPLLTYSCSISPQDYDSEGVAKTFSIHGGDHGGFSSNVLKYMKPSKVAGKYLMVFDPIALTITIKMPK